MYIPLSNLVYHDPRHPAHQAQCDFSYDKDTFLLNITNSKVAPLCMH